MPHLLDKKNVDMLTSQKVFTVKELESRCEIMLENYCKTVIIEANTMVDMARKQILPAVEGYCAKLAGSVAAKKAVSSAIKCGYETGLIEKLSVLTDDIAAKTDALEASLMDLKGAADTESEAYAIRDTVLGAMAQLRVAADEAETLTAEEYWPFPTYGELVYSVH